LYNLQTSKAQFETQAPGIILFASAGPSTRS